jgi:hypothetical protein
MDSSLSPKKSTNHYFSVAEYDRTAVEGLSTGVVAPKCWKSATRVLLDLTNALADHWTDSSRSVSPSQLCRAMTEHHQKFLALEITKCHLSDMGLALYQTTNDDLAQDSSCGNEASVLDVEQLYACLQSLTPAGVDAYTHYVSHLQILCSQLTHDVLVAYQQESQANLLQTYTRMAHESTAQVGTLGRMISGLTWQLGELASLPERLREDLSRDLSQYWNENMHELTSHLRETVETQLQDQLQGGMAQLLESLSSQYYTQWEQVSRRAQDQESRYSDWVVEQNRLFDAQSQETANLRDALSAQRERIQDMTAFVTEAAQKMKPLSAIDSLVRGVWQGYHWLTTGLYICCALNLTWLVTRPGCCRGVRPYLFTLVWMEAALEILFRLSSLEGASDPESLLVVQDMRALACCLACFIYGVGVLGTMVRYLTGGKRVVDKPPVSPPVMETPIQLPVPLYPPMYEIPQEEVTPREVNYRHAAASMPPSPQLIFHPGTRVLYQRVPYGSTVATENEIPIPCMFSSGLPDGYVAAPAGSFHAVSPTTLGTHSPTMGSLAGAAASIGNAHFELPRPGNLAAFSLPETEEDKMVIKENDDNMVVEENDDNMVVEETETEDRKRKLARQDPSKDGEPAKKKLMVEN